MQPFSPTSIRHSFSRDFFEVFSSSPLEHPENLESDGDWTKDIEELHRLSLLRGAEETTFAVPSDEVIDLICGESNDQGIAPTPLQLSFLQQTYNFDTAHLQAGIEREEKIRQVIETGKEDFGQGQAELRLLSQEISSQIGALKPNSSFILYTAVTQLSDLSNNRIVKSLGESFLPPEWASYLDSGKINSVSNLSEHLIQNISAQLQEQLSTYLPTSADETVRGILNFGAKSFLPKWTTGGVTEKAFQGVIDSIKAHIKRDLYRSSPTEWHNNLDSFTSNIVELGLEEAIKREVDRVSKSLGSTLNEKVEKTQREVMQKLPGQAQFLLNSMGFGSENNTLWLEIVKEENGQYTLLIHGMGRSLDQHGKETIKGDQKRRAVLRYSNLTEEQLSGNFIHQILAMRVWPIWSKEINFTLASFYEEALLPLKSHKTHATESDCLPEDIASQIREPWDVLKLWTSRHLNIAPEEEEKEFFFPLQKQCLLALWNKRKVTSKKKKIDRQLERVKESTLNTAMKLHAAGEIDDQELKGIYATACEIDNTLYGERKNEAPLRHEDDSCLINGEISYQLKKIIELCGGKAHRLEAIQAALIEVFGPTMKETIDLALAEIASPKEPALKDDEGIEEEIRPPATLEEQFWAALNDMKEWDVWDYIFFATKVYSAFRHWAFYAGGGLVVNQATEYLHQALLTYVPHYRASAFLGQILIRRMVNVVGVWAVKKFLLEKLQKFIPQSVIDGYEAAIKKAESTALYYAIVWTLPRITSQSTLDKLKRQAALTQQQLLREGSISFKLAAPVRPEEKMYFPIQGTSFSTNSTATLEERENEERTQASRRDLPRPYRVTLTAENIFSEILQWTKDSKAILSEGQGHFISHLHKQYLIRQLENLPLPSRETKTLWDEVRYPEAMMELLASFIPDLPVHKNLKRSDNRLAIQSLRLHAILDYLARRCPDSHLENFSTTPSILYYFLNDKSKEIKNPLVAKQVLDLCKYYRIDPKKKYTYRDYLKAKKECAVEWDLVCTEKRDLDRVNLYLSKQFKTPFFNEYIKPVAGTDYLHLLLEDEGVKGRLALAGCDENTSIEDQLLLLFQDTPLNPSSIPSRSPLFKSTDQRKGLLPRSYHLLQHSNRIAQVLCLDVEVRGPLSTDKQPMFNIHEENESIEIFGLKVSESKVKYASPPFQCTKQYGKSIAETWDCETGFYTHSSPSAKKPTEEILCNKEDQSLLEYLTTHDEESIIRMMGAMKSSPMNLFLQSHFRTVLQLRLFHLGLLWDQIHNREEIVTQIGEAFSTTIRAATGIFQSNSSSYEAKESIIDLIQIAYHTRSLCEDKIPGSWSQFPDLRGILLNEVIPSSTSQYRSALYPLLLLIHGGETPSLLSTKEQALFVHDFCLYGVIALEAASALTCRRPNLYLDYIEITLENPILYWEHLPFIEAFLDDPNNQERRNTLLTGIARNLPSIKLELPEDETLQWRGSFPHYASGSIDLNFSPTSDKSKSIQDQMIDIVKAKVQELVKVPIDHIYEKDGHYIAPKLNLSIHLNEGHLALYKGKYRLLTSSECQFSPPIPKQLVSSTSLIWVKVDENRTPISNFIHINDGWNKPYKKFPLRSQSIEEDSWALSVNWSYVEGEGRQKEEVDLRKENHGLALLSWFTPLDKIKGYRYIDQPDTLCRIELQEYDLAFDIQEGDSATPLAFCSGMLQGFYIAPKQKCSVIKDYSRYLLLENSEGDQKIILSNARVEQLLTSSLLKSAGEAAWSKGLLKQVLERRWGNSWDDKKTTHFIYSVDKEGALSSSDPHAMAYLLTHQMSRGDYTAAKSSLAILERIGRLTPFTIEVQNIFLPLSCLSIIDSSSAALSLTLSLIALWEENLLLPAEATSQNVESKEVQLSKTILLWVVTHSAFGRYLESTRTETPSLTEYKELLILNGLNQKIIDLIENYFLSDSNSLQRAVKLIGIEEVAGNLMMSTEVAARYRYLKKKHSLVGEADPTKLEIALRLLGITQGKGKNSSILDRGNRTEQGAAQRDDAGNRIKTTEVEPIVERTWAPEDLALVVYQPPAGHAALQMEHQVQLPQPKKKKRNAPSTEPNLMKETIQSLAIEAVNPSQNFQTSSDLLRKIRYDQWKEILNLKTPLSETLTVSLDYESYTPGQFSKHFLSYYSLVTNQVPSFIENNREKKEKFDNNRKKLTALLSQLHVQGNSREAVLIQILKGLIGVEWNNSLPTVIELKKRFDETKDADRERKCFSPMLEHHLGRLFNFFLSRSRQKTVFSGAFLERTAEVVIPKSFECLQKYADYTTRQYVLQMLGGPLAPAYSVYSWGKFGFRLLSNIRSIYEEEASIRKRRSDSESCAADWKAKRIPNIVSMEMKRLDDYFDALLEKVSRRHFDAPARATPPLTVTIPLSEEDDLVVREHNAHLNQSCREFDAREKEEILRTSPKSAESLQAVHDSLQGTVSSLSHQIKGEREELMVYINHPRKEKRKEPPTVREAIRRMHNRSASPVPQEEEYTLNFEEVVRLFLMEDEGEWIKQALLTAEQAAIVQERLYLHLIKVTRFNQISRSCDLARQAVEASQDKEEGSSLESVIEELAQELQRKRAYDVETLPSRISRAHLSFEAANRRMLWKKQAEQEDRMLLESGRGLVVEMIMGSGKTYAAVPTTDFVVADGKRGIINFWARSAAAVSTKQTAEQSYRSFGQGAHFLHFDRSSKLDKRRLVGLLRRFENCIENREQLNMIKESAQSFQLGLIMQASEYCQNSRSQSHAEKSLHLEELFYHGRILHLMRKHEVANLDEIHEILNRRSELNYSCGAPSKIKKEWTKTIQQIIRCLLQTGEFREILHLRENQKPIEEALYVERILPTLAEKLTKKYFDSLSPSDKELALEYLCGSAQAVPGCVIDHPERKTIDLIKGVLTIILPKALQQKPKENYGPSNNGVEEYSRPYLACDYPNEQATIRSPFEAIVKTFLSFLYTRISIKQASKLSRLLEQEALNEERNKRIPFNKTVAARLFREWLPGYELSDWKKIPVHILHERLASSDEAVLKYATYTMEGIRYYKKNIKSDSQNFASMFASFYGDTGSLYNHRTYPDGSKILWDKGTQGETKHLMQIKQKVGSVQILEQDEATLSLNEILDRFFNPESKKSALIDRGGILRGLGNKMAAKQMLDYLELNRPDMKGVIFYSDSDELMIWERGSKDPIALSESKLSPTERITLFDQAHTFASDVPQPAEAEALLTLADTKLEEWAQAIWRMRGLRKRQSITVVMGKETRNKISPNEVPTIEEIYAFVLKNEAMQLGEDHFQADRQKIHDVVRSAILDKMYSVFDELDQSEGMTIGLFSRIDSTMNRFLNFFKEFQDFLIVEDSDDPTFLFGGIDAMVDPKEILQHYMAQQFIWIGKSSSFSKEEKAAIWMQMKELANGIYPEKVHTYLQEGEPNHSAIDSFGKEQVSESSNEVENDQQLELNQQRELEQQRQQMIPEIKRIKYRWTSPLTWNPKLQPLDLSWFKLVDLSEEGSHLLETIQDMGEVVKGISSHIGNFFTPSRLKDLPSLDPILLADSSNESNRAQESNVPLYRFKDYLARAKTSLNCSKGAVAFDSNIFCSHNFAPVLQRGLFSDSIDPLACNRKICTELLIIEERGTSDKTIRHIGLIDHSDVAYWRGKITSQQDPDSKTRIGIYQIDLEGMIGASDPSWSDEELLSDPDFIRALVQVKFYKAHLSYNKSEAKALRKWLKESNPLVMKNLFLELLPLIEDPHLFIGSDIDFIFTDLIETFEED